MNIKDTMHKNCEINLQDDGRGGEGGERGVRVEEGARMSSQSRLARDGKNLVLRPHLYVFVVLSARNTQGLRYLG